MKVWRGFTLVLWAILLVMCATFVIAYHSLQTTILDQQKTATWLQGSPVYATLRDEVIAPEVLANINSQLPNNQLLDLNLVRTALHDTIPDSELEARLRPALTNVYHWLDSKEPEVTFSLSFDDKETAFYKALERAVNKKTTSLDSCVVDPYPPEDALLKYRCLPSYLTAKEATQAVMGSIRANGIASSTSIQADQFELPQGTDVGQVKQLPTYLNMLWAINWLALAGLVIIPIFLLFSRRAVGSIAVGVALITAGLLVLIITPRITDYTLTAPTGLGRVAAETIALLVPQITQSASLFATISVAAGVVCVVLGGIWRKKSRGKKKHA